MMLLILSMMLLLLHLSMLPLMTPATSSTWARALSSPVNPALSIVRAD